LLFKVIFAKQYIKIIFLFIFKKLFLTSTHQNNLKTQKKKIEAIFFFKTLLKCKNKQALKN